MSVLQPLYYAGGKFSAGTDRKLLASIFDVDATVKRSGGVISAGVSSTSRAMKVASTGTSNRSVTIKPGMCLIPDASSPSVDSPGYYLGVIDASSETVSFAANAPAPVRTDTVYAVVDETPYIIVNKALTTNTATITTSTAHGFAANQTVVISGVDNIFDGTYVIASVPTSTTFTYAKTHANVTSATVRATAYAGNNSYDGTVLSATLTNKELTSNLATLTTSATHNMDVGTIVTVKGVDSVFDGVYEIIKTTSTTFSYLKVADNVTSVAITSSYATNAIARVPFAIKVEQFGGTTLSGKAKIKLAEVDVPGSNGTTISTVRDYRHFVNVIGGIQYYDSAQVTADPTLYSDDVVGRLRFDVNTNTLDLYDTTGTDGWRTIFKGSTGHHDSVSTDASDAAIHHTLGTGQYQAAKGNHAHDTRYYQAPLSAVDTPASAVSASSNSSITITSTSTSFAVLPTAVTATFVCTTACYVQVFASAKLDVNTSGKEVRFTFDVQKTGSNYVAATPASGSSSNQISATDGTAYLQGDIQVANYAITAGSPLNVNINRLVYLDAGATYTFRLMAYKTDSGTTATVQYPKIVVLPFKQ